MKNVFITGITGFVGFHLAERLVREGKNVTGLTHDWQKDTYFDVFPPLLSKLNVVTGDVCNRGLIERILAQYKIDTVFHLAARSTVLEAHFSPLPVFETNIMGTATVLEACRNTGLPNSILVMSTDKVYGEGMSADEDMPLKGLGIYESSKVAVDQIARSYAYVYDMPITVARCCNIYGLDFKRRIVPNVIRTILEGKAPIIYKEPNPSTREYIYVDDAVDALIFLAENINEARGKAWNMGTGDVMNQEELIIEIMHLAGCDLEPIYQDKVRGKEILRQSVNSTRIQKLGWEPKVSLREGLKRAIKDMEGYYERGF